MKLAYFILAGSLGLLSGISLGRHSTGGTHQYGHYTAITTTNKSVAPDEAQSMLVAQGCTKDATEQVLNSMVDNNLIAKDSKGQYIQAGKTDNSEQQKSLIRKICGS